MTDREMLIKLIRKGRAYYFTESTELPMEDYLADYLLANSVIVPTCKPIGVMTDGTEFNTDVYCPYCGTNLSGLYGEEPTKIIQCYQCGEYLDNRKILTKEEAEKALAERSKQG